MSTATILKDTRKRVCRAGIQVGSSTAAVNISSDGVLTLTGTPAVTLGGAVTLSGTNTFSGTNAISGVATITAAPVLSGNGRPTHSVFIPARSFSLSGSAAMTTLNSKWDTAYVVVSSSANDVIWYGQFPAPEDMDVTYGLTPKVIWSTGAKAASSVADWSLAVDPWASGEATGSASTSTIAAGASNVSASANTIVVSTLGLVGANAFTAGDIVSLALTLDGSSGSTTAGCPYFIGVELDYKASTL